MLAKWTELLPLFIVRWIAIKRCETFDVVGARWALARPDVLIRRKPDATRGAQP